MLTAATQVENRAFAYTLHYFSHPHECRLLVDIHYINSQTSMQVSQPKFLPRDSFKWVSAHISAHYLKIQGICDILSKRNEAIFYEMSCRGVGPEGGKQQRVVVQMQVKFPCVTDGGEKVICEETYLPR